MLVGFSELLPILNDVDREQVTVKVHPLYTRVIIPRTAYGHYNNSNKRTMLAGAVCPSCIMEDGQDLSGTPPYLRKEEA